MAESEHASAASAPREDLLCALVEDGEELAPVAAIVGGVIANNIIRAISGVNAPAKNLVLFSLLGDDGFAGAVTVENMPLPPKK